MRESCRAIIFKDNNLVVMFREKDGRTYHTFPGGGLEEGETLTQCVEREVLEEFGIVAKAIKKVYEYKDTKTKQHFFLCEWVSGEFNTSSGEEYSRDASFGSYIPTLLPMKSLLESVVVPPEVAAQLYVDYQLNKNLKDKVLEIESDF